MIRTPLQVCALIAVITTLTACAEQAGLPELITEAPYAPESGSLLIRCGTLIDGVSDGRRHAEALEAFRSALELDPDDSSAQAGMEVASTRLRETEFKGFEGLP